MPADRRDTLLEVEDLAVHFPVTAGLLRRTVGQVRAVDGVSFAIGRGETLGIVGESGCGKTTVGRAILRLVDVTAGAVRLDGFDILTAGPDTLRRLRPALQMIFQDPHASLNPRMTVADIVGEPLDEHRRLRRRDRDRRVAELMDAVGLNRDLAGRFPHEFSGGQRQRVGIARALALEPKLIVCDEPIAALDISIQAQVVNLLGDLQAGLGLAYLFISHDLGMVRQIADRVAVMYLGRIVELAPTDALYREPLHPYTRALLSAVPRLPPAARSRRVPLEGDVPSPTDPPSGCVFRTRCPEATELCMMRTPGFAEVAPGRLVACHLHAPGAAPGRESPEQQDAVT